jgi:sialate O-acetylesterase
MKATIKLFFSTCILLIGAFCANATIKLPNLISEHMVLQQQSKVKLWGWGMPLHKIAVKPSWGNKTYYIITDSNGNWETAVTTAKAGGPYSISFNDGDELIVHDVLLGEVWLCAGQSNMVMPLKGYDKGQNVLNGEKIIASSERYPTIRVFNVPKIIAAAPLKDCRGDWKISNPQNAPDFSAIAYQYAAMLTDSLHVPVGIISSCWGSTAVQSWMGEDNLKQFPEVTISNRLDTMKVPNKDPENLTAGLFNGMISPLTKYNIKGFIWYQGESNKNAQLYKKLFPAMVKEWRTLWRANLPFYYVQIAPWNYKDRNTAFIREAQLTAVIPNSAMVVSLDAGQQNRIHPPDKTIIAKRLADIALGQTYHNKLVAYKSPELKGMKIRPGAVTLIFKNVYAGLNAKSDTLANFEVAGADQKFYPAKARIEGLNRVVLLCPQVLNPIAVRYAFTNWVQAQLYNFEGIPASSFRTDTFEELNNN